MATPARIGTGDVYPSSGVYLLAAALVVCSACSLLRGSTDTTQAPERVGADPTVACDDAGGVRTRGVLAGHVWEAQVGLVGDRVTVRVDCHTESGVEVQPLADHGQGAIHILSEGGLMVLTAHIPVGWQVRLVLPDGQERIVCRFAIGPGGSLVVAAALPLVELRQAIVVDGDGQVVVSFEDEVLEALASGLIEGTEVIFGG